MVIEIFSITKENGSARIGQLHINGKSLETPIWFPVMSFYCGGTEASNFGGGPYRLLKDYIRNPKMKSMFQGIMTSVSHLVDFSMSRKKIDFYFQKTISEHFNLDSILFVDSGGYKLLNRDMTSPNGTLFSSGRTIRKEVQWCQENFGPDIYVPLDFPLAPKEKGVNDAARREEQRERRRRIAFSIDSHIYSIERKIPNSLLYAIIHGHSAKEIEKYMNLLEKKLATAGYELSDFDGYAIGSLVPLRNKYNEIVDIINAFKKSLDERGLGMKPTHVFGLSSNMLPMLTWLGIDSFDSLSYLFSAMSGRYYEPGLRTRKIDDIPINGFDCKCPICSDSIQKKNMKKIGTTYTYQWVAPIAAHNIWVLYQDLELIKKAIRSDKPLVEYIRKRFRGQKRLLEVVENNHQTTLV